MLAQPKSSSWADIGIHNAINGVASFKLYWKYNNNGINNGKKCYRGTFCGPCYEQFLTWFKITLAQPMPMSWADIGKHNAINGVASVKLYWKYSDIGTHYAKIVLML